MEIFCAQLIDFAIGCSILEGTTHPIRSCACQLAATTDPSENLHAMYFEFAISDTRKRTVSNRSWFLGTTSMLGDTLRKEIDLS
jgi:hypothetical protein